MKKFLLALSVLALFASNTEAAAIKKFNPKIQLDGDLSIDKMREQNLIVVQKAAEGISKTLPQKVDKFTKLTSIDSNGTRLIYTFEVDAGPKNDKTMRQEGIKMAPRILSGICTSAKRFMEADITLTYRYVTTKTKAEILRVDADKSKCPEEL
jgi:hypothetical protein